MHIQGDSDICEKIEDHLPCRKIRQKLILAYVHKCIVLKLSGGINSIQFPRGGQSEESTSALNLN